MDILRRYHLHFFVCFLQWPTLGIVKLLLRSQSAISQEFPLNTGFFSDCSEIIGWKKKLEKKKERKKEREKERKTNSHIACVASVSAGVRRECWDESKKETRNEKGGGDGEKRKPLIPSPSSFFHFVLLSLQLWRNNSIGNACYACKWSTRSNDKQW